MTRKKQILTIVVLLVAIVALLLTALVLRYLNNTVDLDNNEESNEVYSSIVKTLAATEDLSWITTRADNGYVYHFTKDASGVWHCEEEPDFPVSERVSKLVDTLSALQSSYTIWKGETLDMYGLENPVASITYGNDKNEETLLIGRSGVMELTEYCYAKLENENVVYVLNSAEFAAANEDIYSWANVVNPPVLSAFNISKAKIELAGHEPLQLDCRREQVTSGVASSTQAQWYYKGQNISELTEIGAFADEIRAMAFDGMTCLHPTAEDLAAYGFGEPTLLFTVSFQDGSPDYLLAIGGAFQRPESERDFYYCMTNQDGSVYYMKDFGFDALVTLVETLEQ